MSRLQSPIHGVNHATPWSGASPPASRPIPTRSPPCRRGWRRSAPARRRTGVAGGASAALHRRDLGPAGRPGRPERFPTFGAGRGGQWTYHGPGQRMAYVMLDLTRPHGSVPAADVRCYVHGLEEWLIRRWPVRRARRAPRGPRRDLGRDPAPGRRQDRRDRRARVSRWVSWHGVALERGAGPGAFRRHRAVRDSGARRDQPGGAGIPATMHDADVALRAAWEEVFRYGCSPDVPAIPQSTDA